MTLLDQYNASENTEFHAKILIAMAKTAGEKLIATSPTASDYKRLVNICRGSLGVDASSMKYAARLFAAVDVTNESTDQQIQNAVSNNFDALAYTFDPDAPTVQ